MVEVDVTFRCGHTEQFSSPSIADPCGLWLMQPRCSDGIVRVNELIQDCTFCRIKARAYADIKRLNWLDQDHIRLEDVRGHIANEGGDVRTAIDALSLKK